MLFGARKREAPGMTLEGVLAPNGRLDAAPGMAVERPDALCVAGDGRLLYSSANRICRLDGWGGAPETWSTFDTAVTALCAGPDGLVAAGLSGGGLAVLDPVGRPVDGWSAPAGLRSVVDCLFTSGDEIVLVDCGYGPGEDVLAMAPWEEAGRGQVVAVSRASAARLVAEGLPCPMGICGRGDGGILFVTELEQARIVDLAGQVRQSGYPGYPGRLRKTAGGYVMACLARRDPLIEFLKTEKAFVAEMKAAIEPRHWISPRSRPEFSHDFPIELGATRLFGEIKPWAPSFSYGLVIELDDALMPVASAHSRANGRRHDISDVVSWQGELIAVSRASGEILNLGSGTAP